MSTPTTTMRLDEETKRRAKPILEELGLNISMATNLFLKAVVRCNGLPFELRLSGAAESPGSDFVADYLAPVMSARNATARAGFDPAAFRKRLVRRNEIINKGRRIVT